jgi:hypothetical protein
MPNPLFFSGRLGPDELGKAIAYLNEFTAFCVLTHGFVCRASLVACVFRVDLGKGGTSAKRI